MTTPTLKIVHDAIDAPNPRVDWDNLGTMACFHKRYSLGDEDLEFSHGQFNSWDEMEEYLRKELQAVVVLPRLGT